MHVLAASGWIDTPDQVVERSAVNVGRDQFGTSLGQRPQHGGNDALADFAVRACGGRVGDVDDGTLRRHNRHRAE